MGFRTKSESGPDTFVCAGGPAIAEEDEQPPLE
jgi:hypothetical protein